MASHQNFLWNKIQIKFFPDEEALFVRPSRRASKDKLELLKNQLETMLSVDSIKSQPDGISFKVANGTGKNIPELLRSMGATGGESIEDASSIAKQPAEEENKEMEEETGMPQDMGQMQPSADMGQQQMNQPAGGMMMAHYYPRVFKLFFENTFESSTFMKAKKPARRTGKYWQPLEEISGKNRAKINKDDILKHRKTFSRKPKSAKRDEILRSLDKAFNYFFDKIEREFSPNIAEKFADEYYSIDDLNPKDYSKEPGKAEPIEKEDGVNFEVDTDKPINGVDFSDFIKTLTQKDQEDEESYDEIEIEEETY